MPACLLEAARCLYDLADMVPSTCSTRHSAALGSSCMCTHTSIAGTFFSVPEEDIGMQPRMCPEFVFPSVAAEAHVDVDLLAGGSQSWQLLSTTMWTYDLANDLGDEISEFKYTKGGTAPSTEVGDSMMP